MSTVDEDERDPRLAPTREFTVGVFPRDERGARFMAYTRWYNPQWKDCCEHRVFAVNGTEAKKAAVDEHKTQCVKGGDE